MILILMSLVRKLANMKLDYAKNRKRSDRSGNLKHRTRNGKHISLVCPKVRLSFHGLWYGPAIRSVCSRQCVFSSVCVLVSVCSRQCVFSSVCVLVSVCSRQCVFSSVCVLVSVCSRQCVFSSVCVRVSVCSRQCVFSSVCVLVSVCSRQCVS